MANTLIFIFFEYLQFRISNNRGTLDDSILTLTALFLLLSLVLLFKKDKKKNKSNQNSLKYGLAATFLTHVLLIIYDHGMIYVDPNRSTLAFTGALALSFACGIGLCLFRNLKWINLCGTGALTSLVIAAIQVTVLSPRPFIDVFVNNTAAVDHLLSGLNPYQQSYIDIYQGYYSNKPCFAYFPGTLYILAPFRIIFGDIRFANIAGHYLSAILLIAAANIQLKDKKIAWLLGLTWASIPVHFFVLEQAWTDTILAGIIALFIYLQSKKFKPFLAELIAAALLSIKQYAIYPALFLVMDTWFSERLRFRPALSKGVSVVSIFIILLSPFLLLDYKSLYSMSIGSHLNVSDRLDSYNLNAYFLTHHFDGYTTGIQLILCLIGILLGFTILYRGRRLTTTTPFSNLPSALFVAYGFVFIFGKVGACNYYYLLLSFIPWIWLDLNANGDVLIVRRKSK